MRTVTKIALGGLVALLLGGGYVVWRAAPKIPREPFTEPLGRYPVGTREYQWTDSSRAEAYTTDPNDKRTIVVQIWYPAASGATGDTAKYLQHPKEFATWLGAWAARKAMSRSVIDAPVAAGGPFPVLLYNHGGLWTRWSATFATEWLASQGYVVVSVEHFGFSQTERFLDGTKFEPDTIPFPAETGDGKADALASWAYLDDPVFKFWVADARFALDRVTRLNQVPGPLQGAFDLERIGAFGWSFGGATAVQLTADDPRVKAAVDHDGQLFGDVRERGTSRPVLLMHHGIDDALTVKEEDRPMVRELLAVVQGWDSTAREASTADWYEVTIAGTDHGNFSDLGLFFNQPEGRMDPRLAHRIINRYTLQFFDRYLRGAPAGLLDGSEPPPADVTQTTRRAPRADTTAAE
ncbi:MAG: hypothetical protein R2909_04320 [Gemmatimonadales bacterium]